MKLENCKVGMVVKVKSLKKCYELGYDCEFEKSFMGKEVIINGECKKWICGRLKGTDCVEVKLGNDTQIIPLIFLKKIKQAD